MKSFYCIVLGACLAGLLAGCGASADGDAQARLDHALQENRALQYEIDDLQRELEVLRQQTPRIPAEGGDWTEAPLQWLVDDWERRQPLGGLDDGEESWEVLGYQQVGEEESTGSGVVALKVRNAGGIRELLYFFREEGGEIRWTLLATADNGNGWKMQM